MKLKSLFRRIRRWAVTEKMFMNLFATGTIIEFSQVGAGFIDGIIISRFLGAEAMAAEGIVHPVFSILGIISGLLAVGMQVRCAQALGRGNHNEYCRFVSATVCVGAIVSLVITVLLVAFSGQFVTLLGASGNAAELAAPAAKYLLGISIGGPALIMTAILAPAFQLDSGHKTIRTGALIETVSNIIMDVIAVKLGLGLFGVGLATAAASYLNLLYQCTFFLRKNRMFHFVRPFISAVEFLKMLSNGSEKAVRRIANTLRPIFLNNIVIYFGGSTAMAALSVRNNFSNFSEIFGAGIASAVALLTGVYYGEINAEGIEEVNRQEHRLIALFPGALCALLLIFADQIARFYIREDGETLNMVAFAIKMLALQIPLQALVESRLKYLQAVCKKRNMVLLTMATRLVFVVLSASVLGIMFGCYGILASFTVSDALTLAAIYIYYAVRCRKIFPARKDYLDLPASFQINPGDVISLDIRHLEDCSLVSEQLMLFCKGHKIDRRTAYFAALSFEELASNIVKHGFPLCRSPFHVIDLRAVITGSTLVIRLCDDCPQYDVTKQIAAANEPGSDPFHNVGTRIVSKIALDITYLNTFDTNNLIICFRLQSAP